MKWKHGTAKGYNNGGCRCKPCTKAWTEYTRAYRKTPEGKGRANKAARKYSRKRYGMAGVTEDDCVALLKAQKGKCGICKRPITYPDGRNVSVDHDHETGTVRGLLCRTCNMGLGHFRDDTELLLAAVDWIIVAQFKRVPAK